MARGKRWRWLLLLLFIAGPAIVWWLSPSLPFNAHVQHAPGDAIDSLDHVIVFHNDGMDAVHGRNTVDGYNVGLKWQCVEFVKRYYLEHFEHRMANSYGHAKDFFDVRIKDGLLNPDRGLDQFTNPSSNAPEVGDLIVLDGWRGNQYGHVAIISLVDDRSLEVIQQNCGSTRETYGLKNSDGLWRIKNERVLGWLRTPR